jgi:hypothetical protein
VHRVGGDGPPRRVGPASPPVTDAGERVWRVEVLELI